jgi:HTH-type transcriptional regulator/antitoxin HipB
MNYPVPTSIQLRAVLRALRRNRGLTQEQAGELLGVNQKRLATIEKAPGVTGFDQISRLVTALGGRLVVEASETPVQNKTSETTGVGVKGRKSRAVTKSAQPSENW